MFICKKHLIEVVPDINQNIICPACVMEASVGSVLVSQVVSLDDLVKENEQLKERIARLESTIHDERKF